LELELNVVGLFLLGFFAGGLIVYFFKSKSENKLQIELTAAKTRLEVEKETQLQIDRYQELSKQTLKESFQALSSEALEKNSHSLIEIAKLQLEKVHESQKGELELKQQGIADLLKPVREQLEKVDGKLESVEKSRVGESAKIQEQISLLVHSENRLRTETGRLVSALRTPNVRGRWGEIQLRRVAEIAGMINYCDFFEQQTFTSDQDRLRPDMIVKLPGGREIIVDSKVPMQSFLDALAIEDQTIREAKLREHAGLVKRHVDQLKSKNYWENSKRAPEFVVLFLPSESFFSAALEMDPGLLEYAALKNVILGTPTTLISLLQAVSVGWREEQLAKSTMEIQKIGKDFYDKAAILAGHFDGIRKGLDSAVRNYNQAVTSFETRFLSAARKFKELGVPATKDIEELAPIDAAPREVVYASKAIEVANEDPSIV
jgi:DNA recombination protein RmuC